MTQSLASGFIYVHLILSVAFALHAQLCSDENAQVKEGLKKWSMGYTPLQGLLSSYVIPSFPKLWPGSGLVDEDVFKGL